MEKPDSFPMREMMGARAAGMSLRRFLELDAYECDLWMEYAIRGPSEPRTQILICQLIQTVQGALGGTPQSMDKFIPWYGELTGKHQNTRKERMLQNSRAITNMILDKALKESADGT